MIVLFGVFGGSICLCVSRARRMHEMPSSCGMLVYSDVTSAVTKYAPAGIGGWVSMVWMKCFVPLRYEGCAWAIGLKTLVSSFLSLSVGESQPLMIGRNG